MLVVNFGWSAKNILDHLFSPFTALCPLEKPPIFSFSLSFTAPPGTI